jgi:hypothetical protein
VILTSPALIGNSAHIHVTVIIIQTGKETRFVIPPAFLVLVIATRVRLVDLVFPSFRGLQTESADYDTVIPDHCETHS